MNDLIISTFNIKVLQPKPPLPEEIVEKVTKIDKKYLKRGVFTNFEIIEKLKLTPEIRVPLLIKLEQIKENIISSERNSEFVSLFIIQSFFTVILADNLEEIEENDMKCFIKSLEFALDICTKFTPIIKQIVENLTDKIILSKHFLGNILIIDSIINKISDSSSFSKYFIESLNFLASNIQLSLSDVIINHIKVTISKIADLQISSEEEAYIDLLFFTFVNALETADTPTYLHYLFIWTIFELKHKTGGSLEEINLILKNMIFDKKFFVPEDINEEYASNIRLLDLYTFEEAIEHINPDFLPVYQSLSFIDDTVTRHLFNYYAGMATESNDSLSIFIVFLCSKITSKSNFSFKMGDLNSIFFNKTFFDPRYSAFHVNIHPIISIRDDILKIYAKCVKEDHSIITAYLLFINRISEYPALLSEVLFFSIDIYPNINNETHADIFCECLCSQLTTEKFLSSEKLVRHFVFESISQIVNFEVIRKQLLNNHFILDILMNNLIEESSCKKALGVLTYTIFENYKESDEMKFFDSFNKFAHENIEYLRILISFFDMSSQTEGFNNFVYTSYFQDFVDLCGFYGDAELAERVLNILSYSDKVYDFSKLNFDKLFEKITLTDGLYEIMKYHISQNKYNMKNVKLFRGIWNEKTSVFVQIILHSKFFINFLSEMKEITNNSVVQCFYCFKYGFIDMLLDMIPNIKKEEEIEVLLSVFSNISKNISSRPILFSYFRLLRVVEEKRARFVDKLINALVTSISESKNAVGDVLQFREGNGKVTIPSSNLKFSGLTINIYANICSIESGMTFIVFEKEDQSFAKMILSKNQISLVCNSDKVVEPFKIDTNKWQNITISISNSCIKLFTDGENKVTLKTPTSFIQEHFSSISLFNDEMFGQFNSISVFSTLADEKILSDIVKDTTEYSYVLRNPNLIIFYSAKCLKSNSLNNVLMNGYEDAVSTCELYTFVASIRRIFESSKGLEFFITLFSQIHFYNCDGEKDVSYAYSLIDSLAILLKGSNNIQKSMVSMNGFGIISYFLCQLDQADFKIFDHIYIIEPTISNEELLKQFQISLLLNMSLWEHVSGLFYDYIVCCQRSAIYSSKGFHSVISFSRLIYLYLTSAKSSETINEQYKLLQYLLVDSVKNNFDASSFTTLQLLVKDIYSNEKASLPLMKVIKTFASKDKKLWKNIISVEFVELHSYTLQASLIKELPKKYAYSALYYVMDFYKYQNQEKQNEIFDYYRGKAKKNKNINIAVFAVCFSLINKQRINEANEMLAECIESNKKNIHSLDISFYAVLIAFFLFLAPKDVSFLAKIVTNDFKEVYECFNLIFLISDLYSLDLRSFTSKFFGCLVKEVFSVKGKGIKKDFFDFSINLIFMGRNHSAIVEHSFKEFEQFSIIDFICLLQNNPGFLNKDEYGFRFDEKGAWIDEDNVLNLLKKTHKYYRATVFQSLNYMVLLSELFSRNITKRKIKFLKSIFDDAINSEFSAPLSVNIFKNNESFDFPTVKSLNNTIVTEAFTTMEQFYESLVEAKPNKFRFSCKIKFEEVNSTKTLQQIITQNKKYYNDESNSYKRDWYRLWKTISYPRSPYFGSEIIQTEQHYKIGTHYDQHLTPFLMVKNNNFDNHAEASIKRGGITEEEYQELINHDEMLKKGNERFFICDNEKVEESEFKVSNFLWSSSAEKIRILKQVSGVFYVTNKGYIFVSDKKTLVIKNDDVKYVFWAWTNQKPESVQIFTTNYKGYLIRFPGKENHKFVQNLRLCSLPNCVFFQENSPAEEVERLGLTTMWVKRQISNYDYLIWLNLLSGRSFSDSRIYPVMPIIVVDMLADKITYDDKCIRDITKNICYINKNAERLLKDRIDVLEMSGADAFAHPSLYSNPYIVNHFLIRTEPFSTLHIILQDGHFDVSSRLFISFEDSMNRIKGKLVTVREFSPEFYAIPEFLTNINNLKFGPLSDSGIIPNDVGLPKWADSPADFINKQRAILESEYVTNMLSGWIDLIWGYKSVGKAAESCYNTYDPSIYPNAWKIQNELYDENAKNAMLNTLGQIPQNLFSNPHPKKNPISHSAQQTNAVVLCNIPDNISIAVCVGATFEKMKVYTVLQSGRVFCLRLAATNFEMQMQNIIPFPKSRRKIDLIDSPGGTENEHIFVAFAQDERANLSIMNIIKHTIITSKATPHLSEITCISAGQNYILSGGSDACASLWRFDEETIEPINFILAHKADITCCYLSETFGICVTCSSDFTVIITQLPDFTFLRAIDLVLPEDTSETFSPPSSVIVTKELGYIIVFFDEYVESFTLNGIFIGMKKLGSRCIKSCLIHPSAGVDLIVVLLENNEVLLLDQFSFNKMKSIWKGSNRIIDVAFHKSSMNYVLTTDNANVILVPAIFSI